MAFDIQQWLNNKSKDEILFLYKGEVSGTLITDSLDDIEAKLENVSPKIKKKVYDILVECMQNLFHHSADIGAGINGFKGRYAICILSKNNDIFNICSGNFVNQKQKDFLTKHLSRINSLTRDQLKDLYKEILDNQTFSEKGGGGLGMVDIARKAGSKISFDFFDYLPDFYFFSFDINILE